MGNDGGYQIVEPDSLSDLIGNPFQASLAVALLEWIASRFRSDFPELSKKVSLNVIPVAYQGVYPAFGVKYNSAYIEDLSEEIEAAIDTVIENCAVSQMLPFFADSTSDWCEAWQILKRNCDENS
jgi:hypothetical protein